MSDNQSVTSTDMAVDDVFTSIDEIKAKTATYMGKSVHIVSPNKLGSLTRRVERMLASSANTSPEFQEKLIQAHQQLTVVSEENQRLRKTIDDFEKLHTKTVEDAMKANSALESRHKLHLESERAAKTERNGLLQKLTSMKQDLEGQKNIVKTLQKGFDPDALKQALETKEALAKDVGDLNAKLSNISKESQARKDAISKLEATIKGLQSSKNETAKKIEDLKALLHGKKPRDGELVFSQTMISLLGPEAARKLREIAQIAHDDIKQRAFHAAQSLDQSKSKQLKGLAKLFWAVFNWCKNQSFKARKILSGWMDLVLQDLTAGTLKAISFYRDELAKMIELKKELVAIQKGHKKDKKTSDEYGKAESFWEDAYFTSWAILLRVRRNTKSWATKAWNRLAGFCSSAANRAHAFVARFWTKDKGKGRSDTNEDLYNDDPLSDTNADTGKNWWTRVTFKRKTRMSRQQGEPITMFDATAPSNDERDPLLTNVDPVPLAEPSSASNPHQQKAGI